uniref:ATP synthase F0 subunit 8 n=1 Tax=Cepola schlegelii TaxID=1188018 RepID=UPI002028EA3C|nr:ATP synthase F0 subunit 8 [Cepola schlegelii]UPQ43873.1 ATP synthase F0 subunit 8 [Cepola schlegelii]
MPQLNPAPWLGILLFTWLVFLFILPPKVMAHLSLSNPTPKDSKKTKVKSWSWLW